MAEGARDSVEWERLISSLKEKIDPDYGLLMELKKRGVLSHEEVIEAKALNTYIKRNQKILEYVCGNNKRKEFLLALRDSNQSHIANYIEANGVYNVQYGNNWPLMKQFIAILDANEKILVDLLDPDSGLITSLYSAEVLSNWQRNAVNSSGTLQKRNETLLDLLRRCSFNDYLKMIACLRETNQHHIAEILESGGVVLPLHVSGITEDENVDEVEMHLSSAISDFVRETIPNASVEQIRRVLQNAGLNLIGATKGNSVTLYFLCKTIKDLEQIEHLLKTGRINEIIEELFTIVLRSTSRMHLKTSLLDSDLNRATNYFQACQRSQNEIGAIKEEIPFYGHSSVTSIEPQSFGIILQKCYLHSILRECRAEQVEDAVIIKLLASVSVRWFTRIMSHTFKKTVQLHLSRYYKRKLNLSSSYRQFIQENIPVKDLVKGLKRSDCLSDIESECLRKKCTFLHKKKTTGYDSLEPWNFDDLFHAVVHQHQAPYIFDEFLCLVEQTLLVKDFGNGAVVKVELRIPDASNKVKWSQNFIRHINDSKDNGKSKSQSAETVFSQLKDNGMEILNATVDREVVVWLLCKTTSALDKLKAMNSNVIKYFPQIGKYQAMNQTDVNIDCSQFQQNIAFPTVFAHFDAKIDITKTLSVSTVVMGVTKLENTICIMCFSDKFLSSLCIFQSQSPYHLSKTIDLNRIKVPLDIVSCHKNNCLYVLDAPESVWKIKENENETDAETKHSVIKWLKFLEDFRPLTLSVSSDGQLLLVSRFPSFILKLYGSNGVLHFSIQLPEITGLEEPIHAVKTPRGTFLILSRERKYMSIETNEEELVEDDRECNICEISEDGKKLRCFDPEVEGQRLNNCSHMYVDSADQVYVADTLNDRVILLDSDLRWNRVIIPTNDERNEKNGQKILPFPRKLYYDEVNKQLIVGGYQEVNIYTLNQI